MSTSLVSVIIPYFNCAAYLEECLKSIRKQSFREIEIIIVDDASNVSESLVAANLAKKYGCIFAQNPENAGVSFTRNRGLSLAGGKFLTTLDPDDFFLEENYVERMVRRLQGHEGSFFVGSLTQKVAVDGAPLKRRWKQVVEGDVLPRLLARTCYIPCNIFYPTELFASVGGYDSALRAYEDWDFKLRIAARASMLIENVHLAYRIHGNGLSTMGRLRKLMAQARVYFRNRALIDARERSFVDIEVLWRAPSKAWSLLRLQK